MKKGCEQQHINGEARRTEAHTIACGTRPSPPLSLSRKPPLTLPAGGTGDPVAASSAAQAAFAAAAASSAAFATSSAAFVAAMATASSSFSSSSRVLTSIPTSTRYGMTLFVALVKRSISSLVKCCENCASPYRSFHPIVSPSTRSSGHWMAMFWRHCSTVRTVCCRPSPPRHLRG